VPDGAPVADMPTEPLPQTTSEQREDPQAGPEEPQRGAVPPGAVQADTPPDTPAHVQGDTPADAPPNRAAALAEAARTEAAERARRAGEAHAARTAARAAAEAESTRAAEEESVRAAEAEAARTAAVERSRAAAAAHAGTGYQAPRGAEADRSDHIVPGFAPVSPAPAGAGPRPATHDAAASLRRTRRPAVGLAALVVLGFVAAFFGWVSADPFWLGAGQGSYGMVTVTRCEASRCEGQFAGSEFSAEGVLLSGIAPGDRHRGATAPARMLASDSDRAYTGPQWGLHLRWGLGLLVVLLCGVLLGAATGARFLRPLGRRASLGARLLALGGPLVLFAGMLGAALV
jgi:hypothetical protein